MAKKDKDILTLKRAVNEGRLDQFVREHAKDGPGDLDKLDNALKRPASEKTKEAPKASSRDDCGD